MTHLIGVNQAALLLGLNPQTIYRKIKRGELKCHRIGSTIRFNPVELLAQGAAPRHDFSAERFEIPSFVIGLLWDTDPNALSPADPLVIERVLEFGDFAQVRWLLRLVRPDKLAAFLRSKKSSRLSKRSLNFWNNYFGTNDEQKDPAPASEKSLGEDRWR